MSRYRAMTPQMSRLMGDAVQPLDFLDRATVNGWLAFSKNEPELKAVTEIPIDVRALLNLAPGDENRYAETSASNE